MGGQTIQTVWSDLGSSYLSSYSLLNTLQKIWQKSIDYQIIQNSNLLNNINNNITPQLLDSYERQVQLPNFSNNMKIYSQESISYQAGLKVLQNTSYEIPTPTSPQNFFEMATRLNMINDIISLSSTYAFLSGKVSDQEIKSLTPTTFLLFKILSCTAILFKLVLWHLPRMVFLQLMKKYKFSYLIQKPYNFLHT